MMTRAAHKAVLNSAFWSGYIAYDGWRLRLLALAMLPKPKLAANLFPEAEPIGPMAMRRFEEARRFAANFAKLSELLD